MNSNAVFSRWVSVNEVPGNGTQIKFSADDAELQALAQLLDVPEVRRLDARFEVKPKGRTGLAVTGEIDADIVQICGVTLELFPAAVHETIDVTFTEADDRPREKEVAGTEYEADLDLPDLLQNGSVNLGALAAEYLALGMDPYPRSPQSGPVPATPPADVPIGTHRPFSGLKSLFGDRTPKK